MKKPLIARLNKRVMLEKVIHKPDLAFGFDEEFIPYKQVYAEIIPYLTLRTFYGENIFVDSKESNDLFIITCRYLRDADEVARISYKGRVFNVMRAINEKEENICTKFIIKENKYVRKFDMADRMPNLSSA